MSITVGQVSGVIACVGIILHIIIPLIVVIVFVSLLSSEHTAATWSVINRQIQSSLWPVFLRTDSANTRNVARRVRLISILRTLVYMLISIAAFVTPLGLKDVIVLDDPQPLNFQYVQDSSPFGFGTPVRYNRFSRICGYFKYLNCPGAPYGGMATFTNDSGTFNIPTWPGAVINSSISPEYMEMFTSATSGPGNTLSGPLDIQYRLWLVDYDPYKNLDGGRPYAKGIYRRFDNLVVRNETVLIEGVVADMMNGGVGYRNHTVPTDIPYGATWEEDLTWVEPVTECVDTNLTFHFFQDTDDKSAEDIRLVDNGGFTNLKPEWPGGLWQDRQDPDLRARAYKAAWINNAMTAIYLNVTRPGELDRMNSSIGQKFITGSDTDIHTPRLYETRLTNINGAYLALDPAPINGNPYNISSSNFTDAATICQGWGVADMANYTNSGVYCGYLYGPPRRLDGGDPLIFEPRKNYTQNLYICATALRQKIKTVSFLANKTADIRELHVTNVRDKLYADNKSMPLWAIEHSNLTIRDLSPVFGIVDDRYENAEGFDTVRARHLWLPAVGNTGASFSPMESIYDSLAAPSAFQNALYSVYSYAGSQSENSFLGTENIAMNRLWSQLSKSPTDAAKIIDLIWTELTATTTVGIKAVTTDGNSAGAGRIATPYAKKVGYDWAFAIPGFLVLVASFVILLSATFFAITSRFKLGVLRQLLNQTATGRVATNLMYPATTLPGADTKQWASTAGKTPLTFSIVEQERTGGKVTSPGMPLPGHTMAASFPGIGTKQGEYIRMQENPSH